MRIFKIFLVFILSSVSLTYSQEQTHLKNRVAGLISHSYLTQKTGGVLAVPSFGVDYEHWLNEKFGLGIFADIELITNEIVKGNSQISREFPVVITADMIWKPLEKVELVIGPGVEIENGESIKLVRIGTEYDLHLGHHWDVAPSLFYDHKFEHGGAFSIGIGVGKSF